MAKRLGRIGTWRWAVAARVARRAGGLAEQVELLAGALDARVEAEQRLEVVERRALPWRQRTQVARTSAGASCPPRGPLAGSATAPACGGRARRAPGTITRKRMNSVVVRDARVAPEDGLGQHGGPFDLNRRTPSARGRTRAQSTSARSSVRTSPRYGGSERSRLVSRAPSGRGHRPGAVAGARRSRPTTPAGGRASASTRSARSCSWARREQVVAGDASGPGCWPGCGSSGGRPGRAPRRAGRGR